MQNGNYGDCRIIGDKGNHFMPPPRFTCAVLALFGLVLALLIAAPAARAQTNTEADFLTLEERQWLSGHSKLRLGVGIAFPPYQWVEQNGGQYVFKGMVSDYIEFLEKKLNVRMEIVYGIKFNEGLDLGRKKEIDLFPCLADTPERAEFLLFTKPYISYPSIIIMRENAPLVGGFKDLSGRRMAVVKHLVAYSRLTREYAHLDFKFVATANVSKNLEAVSLGRADACVIDLGAASYLIQKMRLSNLKVASPTDWERIELAMGVRNDWPMLTTIIQKALNTITQPEKDAITERWIRLLYKPGIEAGLILRWGLGTGVVILSGFTLFFFWNRSLRREIDERKRVEMEKENLIHELKHALSEVKTLRGFLPICASCKKIRDNAGYWQQIEHYIQDRSEAEFSHSICPDCMHRLYPDMADKMLAKPDKKSDPDIYKRQEANRKRTS